jgi:FolB domain-containing protein
VILRIRNLKAFTTIGVYEEELKQPRPLLISIVIDYDHANAVEADSIAHAYDYAVIENIVVSELSQRKFQLIETVTVFLCQLLLGNEYAREVTVEVEKPGVMRFAEGVSSIHSMRRE